MRHIHFQCIKNGNSTPHHVPTHMMKINNNIYKQHSALQQTTQAREWCQHNFLTELKPIKNEIRPQGYPYGIFIEHTE